MLQGESLRDDAMKPFADGNNVNDAHIAQVRFGRDIALEPGSQWFTEEISKDGKRHREGNQHKTPKVRPSLLHRDKGEGRREKRGGSHIGATARVDGQSALAGAQTCHRFIGCGLDIVLVEVAHQVKACRVGMSAHGLIFKFAGKDVKCCVFNRVVSSGFKNKRQV